MKTNPTAARKRPSKQTEPTSADQLSLDELKRFAVQTGVKAGAGQPYRCGCYNA